VIVKVVLDLPLCEIIDDGKGLLRMSTSEEKLYVVVVVFVVAARVFVDILVFDLYYVYLLYFIYLRWKLAATHLQNIGVGIVL
jgi:hypothetical protein